MAIGSTIPINVIKKVVPIVIAKLGILDKLSSMLLSKCNTLPLHIKCNDPRITAIKKLLTKVQKVIKSIEKLLQSLNKVIKVMNIVVGAATAIKIAQLMIPLPPGAPPGPIAEVLGIVNKLLANIKSGLVCFIAIIDIIDLSVSLCNMALARAFMLLGSVCNSESFNVTTDVKRLIDDRSKHNSTSATAVTNNGDSLITESNSLFYYSPVASDDDTEEYIKLLNTIAQDLEDPMTASNYIEEAPSLVHSGNGIPAISLGKLGDYYVDLVNSKIYGPKSTDTAWA